MAPRGAARTSAANRAARAAGRGLRVWHLRGARSRPGTPVPRSVGLPAAGQVRAHRAGGPLGRVIECERGWRGTFAYPTHLYLVHGAPTRRQQAEAHSLAGRLAVYGVPVDVLQARTLPELLVELADREGALSGAP